MEKFVASKENIRALRYTENGIIGLLGADSIDRKNYYLSEEQNRNLFNKGVIYDKDIKITIYKTDLRLEKIEHIEEKLQELKNDKNLIIFTHEWTFREQESKIEKICKYGIENRYNFEFPMNMNNY